MNPSQPQEKKQKKNHKEAGCCREEAGSGSCGAEERKEGCCGSGLCCS